MPPTTSLFHDLIAPIATATTADSEVAVGAVIGLVLATAGVLAVRVLRADGSPAGDLAQLQRDDLGSSILVPIARPRSATELTELATDLVPGGSGRIVALHVLRPGAGPESREASSSVLDRSHAVAAEEGLDVDRQVRVARSVATGIIHAAVEHGSTLVVVGWPSSGRDGSLSDPVAQITAAAPAPVVVARLEGYEWHNVALRREGADITTSRAAVEVAKRIAASRRIPLEIAPSSAHEPDSTSTQTPDADGAPGSVNQLTVVASAPDPDAVRSAVKAVARAGDALLVLGAPVAASERRSPSPREVS